MNIELPGPVARYIEASNAGNRDGLLASFVEDALVNDAQREFRGTAAILTWAEREIFGANVVMRVERADDHHDLIVVLARVEGTFPKAGLPDPLRLTFYFTLAGDKIASLIILLNKTSHT